METEIQYVEFLCTYCFSNLGTPLNLRFVLQRSWKEIFLYYLLSLAYFSSTSLGLPDLMPLLGDYIVCCL